MSQATPLPSWLRKRLPFALLIAVVFVAGTGHLLYVTKLQEGSLDRPVGTNVDPPPSVAKPRMLLPLLPPPLQTPTIYAAVHEALVAAGVDDDKANSPAADLTAAIEQNITRQTDALWFYGEIAVGLLVPLWLVLLFTLLRIQRGLRADRLL